MRVYNTLTRKKEELIPIEQGRVGMYVCGPTVYDEPHIGHIRSAYIFDVIRNYLKYKGFDVRFVRNITDVDDKIIERAQKESKDICQLSDYYLNQYHKALEAFGIAPPDFEPKATQHIADMIDMIKGLIEKGYAYEADGSVYFSVRRFKKYGRLSNRSVDELEAGARIEQDERKQDPLDFALWKHSKENEPYWESPWGRGRPGWHIECSCMSARYLGETFDFHCGGIDLVFPHHENEIAQSESFTGRQFVRYWLHNGLVTINQEKMSKSLGNFVSLDEFIARYSPEALKLFFLESHYSNPIDFTWHKLEQAHRALERFYVALDTCPKEETQYIDEKTKQDFTIAMDDDFNTPAALASMYELVSRGHRENLKDIRPTLVELGRIFGLFTRLETVPCPDERIDGLVRQRDEARKKGDFELADRIRMGLFKEGIILEDKKDKTIWRVKH